MSPTSTSSRAAPEGPIPCRSVSVVPVAASSCVEFFVRGLLAGVDPLEIADQLRGDPAAGLAGDVTRADRGQQRFGLGRGQILLRPARDQLQQQPMQLGDHPGVVLAEGAATVDQQPQHRQLLVVDDRAQPGHPGADQRDRMRVGRVGLAALTGREHPGAGRQLRRHVDHLLTVGEQPVRDVPADALAALDRPRPLVGTASRTRASPDSPPTSVAIPAAVQAPISSPAITSIVADRLCGSIPITTAPICCSPIHSIRHRCSSWEGTATSSRANPS